MDHYQIVFWTPGHKPQTEGKKLFGCSSHGMFTEDRWIEPGEDAAVYWKEVEGAACAGTYDQVIETARTIGFKPSLILVFIRSGAGGNAFVKRLREVFGEAAIMGGAAAKTAEQETGEVLPDGDEASVLFVANGDFSVDSKNIHANLIEEIECELCAPREISRVRRTGGEWMMAADYFDGIRNRLGAALSDYESITFHEKSGKNVHMSAGTDRHLNAGSDIEDMHLLVGSIERSKATGVIGGYLRSENTLSIGCAGLRSLVVSPFTGSRNNVGVFLFGEIVCFPDGVSRFGNLMLGKVVVRE